MKPSIAHIGIAVTDVDAALAFYRDVLGVEVRSRDEVDGARIVHLDFDSAEVELLEPLREDSPIAKFLVRRGPGIHHICYRVKRLIEVGDAITIAQNRAKSPSDSVKSARDVTGPEAWRVA